MTIFPAALILLIFWLWVSVRDADRSATVAIAVLPFGMFAAIDAGGLSLLVAHVLASATLGLYALRRIGGGLGPIRLQAPALLIFGFALYAVFSATVLVRLFEGEFFVFPMSVELDGVRVSHFFPSTVKPLAPSSSNVAQAGYILLSALVFVVFSDIAKRRGIEILETGLVWAAGLNIILGVLDLAGADPLLAFVRTADYTLANEHFIFGLPRVIGGFSEASAFGSVSAVFFSYFAMSYLIGEKSRHGFLALGNLAFTLVSFSSTGMAAVAAGVILIALHGRNFLGRGISRAFAHWLVIALSFAIIALCIAAIATPLINSAAGVFDELFVQKSASESGLERSAWARASLAAFIETWGLGAGAGSLRANGYAASLLGSVGLPGVLLFLTFVWVTFGPVTLPAWSDELRVSCAARVAAFAMLCAKMVSGTTPDPEILLMAFAAIAATVRLSQRRGTARGSNRILQTALGHHR